MLAAAPPSPLLPWSGMNTDGANRVCNMLVQTRRNLQDEPRNVQDEAAADRAVWVLAYEAEVVAVVRARRNHPLFRSGLRESTDDARGLLDDADQCALRAEALAAFDARVARRRAMDAAVLCALRTPLDGRLKRADRALRSARAVASCRICCGVCAFGPSGGLMPAHCCQAEQFVARYLDGSDDVRLRLDARVQHLLHVSRVCLRYSGSRRRADADPQHARACAAQTEVAHAGLLQRCHTDEMLGLHAVDNIMLDARPLDAWHRHSARRALSLVEWRSRRVASLLLVWDQLPPELELGELSLHDGVQQPEESLAADAQQDAAWREQRVATVRYVVQQLPLVWRHAIEANTRDQPLSRGDLHERASDGGPLQLRATLAAAFEVERMYDADLPRKLRAMHGVNADVFDVIAAFVAHGAVNSHVARRRRKAAGDENKSAKRRKHAQPAGET